MFDFAQEATFTGKSLASVMDQFNQEIRPAKPKLWPFPRSTKQNTCMLVKLHVPAKFRDTGLDCVRRMKKRLPPGWKSELGRNTLDGTFQLAVTEQQLAPPAPRNETDHSDIANGLLGFIQKQLGIASPNGHRAVPENKVLEKLKKAYDLAKRQSPALQGQMPARLKITYCRQELEPALSKIIKRMNDTAQKRREKGPELKLNYLVGSIDSDTDDWLEKYWFLFDIQYADEPGFGVTDDDPSTNPDPGLVDIDPTTEPDLGSLTLTVTRGGKAVKTSMEVDEQGMVTLGRCGPQKNSICHALRQLGAEQYLSSQASLALELVISDKGGTVTAPGNFKCVAGKALTLRQHLPFPISTKSGNFVFQISQS